MLHTPITLIFDSVVPDKIKELTLTSASHTRSTKPIAAPVDQALLIREIQSLGDQLRVLEQGPFEIFRVKAQDIPVAMQEIGRLREITFRAVGEGTGHERDLDDYDTYYWQLIIWDSDAQQIIGGYRIGEGATIFKKKGIAGFYIASLFEIQEPFGIVLQETVELGRSFIIPEYQKKRLPLFLLWKGILYFLLQHSEYRYVIGPVSVSKFYSDVSKSLIIAFVRKHYFDHHNAQYITPRKPFKYTVDARDLEEKLNELQDLEALENLIETIEPDHIKLPVLLKQYIRQNARFIGFNLDPNFNNALDGLMILDLAFLRQETVNNLKKSW